MDWLFRTAELSGLLLLILVATSLHRRAYGAGSGRVLIGEHSHHGLRNAFNLWATFLGILLIATFCWLIATSILGENWAASCVAVCLFFAIGLNLMDEDFGDSDQDPRN